jgi:phage terminase small subunit
VAIETTLTMKQQKFCHEYVKTGNAVESYMTAYDCNSYNAARQESNKFLKRDDFTQYIQALTRPTINKIENEREKKRNWLWNMIDDPTTDNSDRLRAMDILNKMDQEYVNITRTEDNKTDISTIDSATLVKLASGNSN